MTKNEKRKFMIVESSGDQLAQLIVSQVAETTLIAAGLKIGGHAGKGKASFGHNRRKKAVESAKAFATLPERIKVSIDDLDADIFWAHDFDASAAEIRNAIERGARRIVITRIN